MINFGSLGLIALSSFTLYAWLTSSSLFKPIIHKQPLFCTPLRVESPDHPINLKRIVAQAYKDKQQISIVGAGYSQGGQTCASQALQINIREMNQLINLNLEEREVTVQSGITWQQLQERLSIFGLSVSAMQSYADFTVGGSLGVNAHGQDVNWNPLSRSVVSMRVLMTDGRTLNTSRSENPELFKAVLGTYGLVGIITEVTLKVLPNTILLKQVDLISTHNYNDYITGLSRDKPLALHSARLSINPLYRFKNLVAVNFFDTGQLAIPEQEDHELNYPDTHYLNLVKKSWLAQTARTTVEYFWLEQNGEMTRNQAMGESVVSLKNTVAGSKDILQEYFIPPDKLQLFIGKLKEWLGQHSYFTLINATIRKVNADRDSLLPYAPEDRFAVVLFINLPDNETSNTRMQNATRELIDTVLDLNGRYYLPYALYASYNQFWQAYPEFKNVIEAKTKWDRAGLLTNRLYQSYGTF